MTFEQLIAQQQPHIERVVLDLACKNYLASAEREEFRASVYAALERNDYELLQAFEGRSTWETYLQTVITREFFLFQARLWGEWRPTMAALRIGAAAMLLEELVVRDRFALNDAIEWMRTRHRVDLSRHRLMQMAAQLGIGAAGASSRTAAATADTVRDPGLDAALRTALLQLSPEDRLIVELRFRDRHPLTRVAAVMKIEVRPLQRRIEEALQRLRASLVEQRVKAADIEALLRSADTETAGGHQKWWDLVLARPSKESNL